MTNKFTDAMDLILKIVVDHKRYLVKNPKVIAWLMGEYDDIHYSSRYHKDENMQDWANPKYAVLDLQEFVGKKYANLVYNAWCSNLYNEEDSGHRLERKPNKTMDDFVEMCLDPEYRFKSIFPTRISVLDHMLFTIGNGMTWTKEGYIEKKLVQKGSDSSLFWGFETVEVPDLIYTKCSWLNDEEISHYRKIKKDERQKVIQKEKDQDKLLSNISKKLGFSYLERRLEDYTFYPLSEYSLINNLPKNAHTSYKMAAIEICNLIKTMPNETKENKEKAAKILKKLSK